MHNKNYYFKKTYHKKILNYKKFNKNNAIVIFNYKTYLMIIDNYNKDQHKMI